MAKINDVNQAKIDMMKSQPSSPSLMYRAAKRLAAGGATSGLAGGPDPRMQAAGSNSAGSSFQPSGGGSHTRAGAHGASFSDPNGSAWTSNRRAPNPLQQGQNQMTPSTPTAGMYNPTRPGQEPAKLLESRRRQSGGRYNRNAGESVAAPQSGGVNGLLQKFGGAVGQVANQVGNAQPQSGSVVGYGNETVNNSVGTSSSGLTASTPSSDGAAAVQTQSQGLTSSGSGSGGNPNVGTSQQNIVPLIAGAIAANEIRKGGNDKKAIPGQASPNGRADTSAYAPEMQEFLSFAEQNGYMVDSNGNFWNAGRVDGEGDSGHWFGVASDPARYTGELAGLYQQWKQNKAKSAPNPYDFGPDDFQPFDPKRTSELDAATKAKFMQDQGANIRAMSELGTRGGVSSEQLLGQVGNMTSNTAVALASKQAEQRMQLEIRHYEQEYNRLMTKANMAADAQSREAAWLNALAAGRAAEDAANRAAEADYERGQRFGWKDGLGLGLGLVTNAAPALAGLAGGGGSSGTATASQGLKAGPGTGAAGVGATPENSVAMRNGARASEAYGSGNADFEQMRKMVLWG